MSIACCEWRHHYHHRLCLRLPLASPPSSMDSTASHRCISCAASLAMTIPARLPAHSPLLAALRPKNATEGKRAFGVSKVWYPISLDQAHLRQSFPLSLLSAFPHTNDRDQVGEIGFLPAMERWPSQTSLPRTKVEIFPFSRLVFLSLATS